MIQSKNRKSRRRVSSDGQAFIACAVVGGEQSPAHFSPPNPQPLSPKRGEGSRYLSFNRFAFADQLRLLS